MKIFLILIAIVLLVGIFSFFKKEKSEIESFDLEKEMSQVMKSKDDKKLDIFFFSYSLADAKNLKKDLNALGYDIDFETPEELGQDDDDQYYPVSGNTGEKRVINMISFEKEMNILAKKYNSEYDGFGMTME